MFGSVSTSWGNPAIVQVGGTVTAQEVHLTLSCIPSNGATDAFWTGTRFEGTWQFSGASGHTNYPRLVDQGTSVGAALLARRGGGERACLCDGRR